MKLILILYVIVLLFLNPEIRFLDLSLSYISVTERVAILEYFRFEIACVLCSLT